MTWTFTISEPTPSLNEIQGWHWRHVVQEKQRVGWLLLSALSNVPAIPRATGKRRLTIIRHGKGQLDRSNLWGGVKWLEDAIRARRLILDDDEDHCELLVSQVVDRGRDPFTEVVLEDVEAA